MEEFTKTSNPDFAVVTDGHDGQTEEEKRDAFAAAENGNGGNAKEETSTADTEPESGKAQQKQEDDSGRMQAARRSGEQEGYDRAYREINQRIARSGMRNPGSGEAIQDIDALETFGQSVRKQRIQERAKREGRTEAEVEEEEANQEFLTQSRRNAEEKKRAEADAAKRNEWIDKDLRSFREKYPDVDIEKLDNNAEFRRFCGSRYAKEPLADLYADYMEITGGVAKAAAVRAESKDSRSTSGSRTGGGVTLTSDQRAELEDWNRRYPKLKMTEQEFASRG